MAKNTRYRSLEDQLKKQESRPQEIAETVTTIQTSGQNELQEKLHYEMEHNNSRLEAIVGNLDQKFSKMEQKFNALLKVMMKEKGLQDNDGGAPDPLLPTTPAHLKLMTPNELAGHPHETKDFMVVWRLRKNTEFHLDDSPRRKPQEGRHPSAANNNATASSGIEQTDASEGAMLGDCWSKECSSSNNSHSTEQIESGFECDDKVPNELSPYASSSHQKDCDSIEEDYFADIMKDDIIQLDDSAIYASTTPANGCTRT